MMHEQQLSDQSSESNLQTNLTSGMSAAATLMELASCHSNAAAAVPAAAALAEYAQVAAAPSAVATTSPAIVQPSGVGELASGTAAAAASSHAGAGKVDAVIDRRLPKLGSLLSSLGQKVLGAVVGLVSATSNAAGNTAAPVKPPTAPASSSRETGEELLQSLAAFQQKLPSAGDRLQMLKEHRAWLDQVKDYLVKQHTDAQVRKAAL